MAEKCRCSRCNRIVSGRAPVLGDGSAALPYRHKNLSGEWCSGQHDIAEWHDDTPPETFNI